MMRIVSEKNRLGVGLLVVLCTAHLLISSTARAHGDIGGPRVIRGFLEDRAREGGNRAGYHHVVGLPVDRSKLEDERGPLRVVQDGDVDGVIMVERPADVSGPEPEGFWDRAWSYVSRVATPIGAVLDPLTSWGRKLVSDAETEHRHEREHPHQHDHGLRQFLGPHDLEGPFHRRRHEEDHGRLHRFHEDREEPLRGFHEGHHKRLHRSNDDAPLLEPPHEHRHDGIYSFFDRVGHAFRKRPDQDHPVEMELRSTEEMDTKVTMAVLKAVAEFTQTKVSPPEEGTACLGIFEEQLRTLFRSVKSALREEVCADDAASDYNICKLSHSSGKTAALMAFAKAKVDALETVQITIAAVCSPPDVYKSLEQVEILLSYLGYSERLLGYRDVPLKHFDQEHHRGSRFGEKFRHHEHGPRGNWRIVKEKLTGHVHTDNEQTGKEPKEQTEFWRAVKDKVIRHKQDQLEEREPEHGERELKEHEHREYGHKEHGEDEHEHEHEHEHKHEQEHDGSFFGVFHKLKHMLKNHKHHHRNLGAFEHDCFVRGVYRMKRGLKEAAMVACSSASTPDLINACKFAKEHKFLVKTYISMEIAKMDHIIMNHCAAKQFRHHEFNRYVGERNPGGVDMRYRLHRRSDIGNPSTFEMDMPHLKRMSGCARHRAHQAFRNAVQLRGQLLDEFRAPHAAHPEAFEGDLNANQFHAHDGALVQYLHDSFPELQDIVTKLLQDSQTLVFAEEKPLRISVDPSDPSKGLVEFSVHTLHLPSSPRKLLLGPTMRHETVEFPMPFVSRRPHFRISARPRTIPDVVETVDTEDTKVSKIALSNEGH